MNAFRAHKGFANVLQLSHQLAAGCTRRHLHSHAPHLITARTTFGPQCLKPANAALAAGAACFDTFANPNFFLCQKLVGLGADHRLLLKLSFFVNLVLCKIAWVAAQLAAVQFQNTGGNTVQESSVVGNGHHAALEIKQQLLQPRNGIQV